MSREDDQNIPTTGQQDLAPLAPNDPRLMMQYDANKKSTGVAFALWFFLGMFGAHRFYLGTTGPAVAMLVLTVLGIITAFIVIGWFFLLAVAVWAIVDAFMIPGIVRTYNNELINKLS